MAKHSLPSRPRVELSDPELRELVEFAELLAEVSGRAILRYFRQHLHEANKARDGSFDPVTAADQEAEHAMRDLIWKRFPDHGILGEEHGFEEGKSGLTWVLDPIDGTRAFLTGIPLWGTLIALHDGASPVLGVMNQPFTEERFVASRFGAFLRHRGKSVPLKTRSCQRLADARLQCTHPAMFSAQELTVFERLAQQVRLTRFSGDCYAYCMVALGCVDLVVESGLEPYDVQALIPIVERAGGVMTDWRGSDCTQGGQVIAAANATLHAQALSILAPAAQ